MRMKMLMLAAAFAVTGAVSGQAATITMQGNGTTATGSVTSAIASSSAEITFNWTGTPVTSFQIFEVDRAFELILSAYNVLSSTPTNAQTSGWVLKLWNEVTNTWQNMTTSTANCTAAVGDVSGNCNHVASTAYNGAISVTRPGETLAANGGQTKFAAGTYMLGLYDSSVPREANATFRIAAVPLPATGLALIAGLGGLAALGSRRRRTAA